MNRVKKAQAKKDKRAAKAVEARRKAPSGPTRNPKHKPLRVDPNPT